MKVGADIRLVISDLDDQGDGVGLAPASTAASFSQPLEVHVPSALPGEEISARIDAVSSHKPVAWATLRQLHRPSGDRVPAACPAQGRCGGCVLQHYDVAAQRAWKEASLRRLFAAEPTLASIPVSPMVPSPLSLGYRNNSKLVAARAVNESAASRGPLMLGAYERRTHRVVDLLGCQITEPALEEVTASLRELLNAHAVDPYDEAALTGTLRYAILRGTVSGQVLVTLVTAGPSFPGGEAIAQALRARHSNVAGVVHNMNPSRGNALYGADQRTLAGSPTVEDRIGDIRLRLSSRSFFQANRQVANAAYQAIVDAAALTGRERVVDAYAGVGGIALTLASRAHIVLGIEEHPAAVEDASHSATLNGIANVTFVAGDVAAHLGAMGAADVVVLNPPRKGCASEVLQQVAALRPRLVAYLSCAPDTLIRDLVQLAALDYRTDQIVPFDMLPHTPHIETLVVLRPPE